MNNKILNLIVCLIMFFTLAPTEQVYAYSDLEDFNNYIKDLDITYKDLSLTPEELAVIKNLQKSDGITYGMYQDDNSVFMVFQQISKVFDIKVTPVVYDDFSKLLTDIENGTVDFTASLIPTEERLEIFDFTTSTHKDKIFLFIKHEDFELINSNTPNNSRVLRIGYPTGFALEGMLSDKFKEIFKYELVPIPTVEDAVELVKTGKLDMVYGDITWYSELVAIENYMAIDNTNYIDTYFSGNPTKKGTNKELISAINKMYAETNALIELQNQIDNYYEEAALYALKVKYYDLLNHDKINQVFISEYRPYVYKEGDAYSGLFVDLLKEIFDYFDLQYKITESNDINSDYFSESGITVAMPVFVTYENKARYNLTIPVAESNMVVITKPDDTSKFFKNVEDLELQKVGGLDFSYMYDYVGEVFLDSKNVLFYKDFDSLTSAIDNDEIKFAIVPYEEFNKYAIENQLTHISVLSSLPLPKYSIAFGTPKTERGLKYEALLSSVLSILNYSDLENKYLSTTPEMEAVYEYKAQMLNFRIHVVVFLALFTISLLSSLIYINKRRANMDYLTKLKNRRTLNAYIKTAKTKKNMSIAYIDLDNFKAINDIYGHHYGDEVLIYVAQGLLSLSNYSRAFRIGGDEFIIVYNNKEICFNDNIRPILNKIITIKQIDIKVEGSVGNLNLETYSDLDVDDIVNLVDYAMMSAKRRGKNIIIEIDDELVNNYTTIRDLRTALENGEYEDTIKFYFDSIKYEDKIQGFCLVAKCHHKNHYISYEELRKHMSNKVILNKIGLLMFEKLCQSIKHMNETSQLKMHYIYNLEAESVNDQNISLLAFLLAKYDISPRDITLRISPDLFSGSKGVFFHDLLNNLGCRISIDYFKITGKSLLYLNYLDFTLIELDLSGLLDFLKNKNTTDTALILKEITDNLALKKIIELCNMFHTDLLLYINDDVYLKLVKDYLVDHIDTNIYYIEKNNLTLLDDYLTRVE